MKNFLVFAIFTALVFVVSCGGGSSSDNNSVANFGKLGQECYPNKSCDEGLLCEEETNRCIEDPENPSNSDNENSDNDSTENNDSNPVEDNDKDNQPNDNDKDDKDDSDVIDDNNKEDKDDSDSNDSDTTENNDNDDNPSENDDSDNIDNIENPNVFFYAEMVATKEQLENTSQDQINHQIQTMHAGAERLCPYNYSQNPEQYDKEGNLYVVDNCENDFRNPIWIENVAPLVLFDRNGKQAVVQHRVVSMTVNYSNKGSSSNMKVRVPGLVIDVNFSSASCLSQGNEDTSVITSEPNPTLYDGCKVDDDVIQEPSFETKSKKQTKAIDKYVSLCATMPNYHFDEQQNTCYTTIEEFVWLENVIQKLLTSTNDLSWFDIPFEINRIERHLDTNVFYMDITIGNNSVSNKNMKVHVELKNAKSCIDQCHGQEGCTSHIEPNINASKGCIINGEEVNGKE
ncbi:hypothetical protein J6W78_11005 [bacterium]|nr:hypothetical protein [bacterium]